MMDGDPRVTEEELHAYVDGELAADRQRTVEAWLASHPEDAARVAQWRAQAEAIRARFGALAS
ncbi:MAG TPA: anti-sigma factor, partial [Xanthobacteraceae bacterium]|nr:anti-sigma factor [Xanthobacteraceae bacterium]